MSHPDPIKEYDEVESHKVWQEAIHPPVLEQANKYNKDPFGQSIESKKREKFFTERLNKYGNPIIESLVLTLMDNIHEASEELVGDAHLTNEQLDEYLNDAKMIILHKINHEIASIKDKVSKESILFYWSITSSKYNKL